MKTLTKQDLENEIFASEGRHFLDGAVATYTTKENADIEISFPTPGHKDVMLRVDGWYFTVKGLKEFRKLLKTMIQDMECEHSLREGF